MEKILKVSKGSNGWGGPLYLKKKKKKKMQWLPTVTMLNIFSIKA